MKIQTTDQLRAQIAFLRRMADHEAANRRRHDRAVLITLAAALALPFLAAVVVLFIRHL